jgi:hypothetical protein
MIRRWIAAVASVARAVAVVAHLGGNENLAEIGGVIAFFALLAAVAIPPRGSERDEPA